jgi:hypothetical protein
VGRMRPSAAGVCYPVATAILKAGRKWPLFRSRRFAPCRRSFACAARFLAPLRTWCTEWRRRESNPRSQATAEDEEAESDLPGRSDSDSDSNDCHKLRPRARRLGRMRPPTGRPAFHRCKCGRTIPGVVRHCSTRTCAEYAPTWARDNSRRLRQNLQMVRIAVMFSITAPGADVYPFDRSVCGHEPGVRCSGRIGCRVNGGVAAKFNSTAGKWWRELNRVAKLRADRSTGYRGKLIARVWEKQKRGLAHVHVSSLLALLRSSPGPRRTSKR